MATTSTAAQGLGAYSRHRPEDTLLYEVVRSQLEPFMAHAREHGGRPLPRYVEQAFRAYLRCGILAHGFLRARCDGCGIDLLVAFSCKGRSACPSCAARRMTGTAAQLVDRVLPDVPVRQWVLSLPFDLRLLLATRADLLTAVLRVFIDEVFRRYAAQAAARGLDAVQCGAVTFVQRFGGSLNLNVHFHVVVLDGVYTRSDESAAPGFHPSPAPGRATLAAVATRVCDRVRRLLRRRGADTIAPAEDGSAVPTEPEALTACLLAGAHRGTFATLDVRHRPAATGDNDEDAAIRFSHRAVGPHVGEAGGFNVHAGVTIAGGDREGRERLCRYGARPALSLQRLSQLPDGRLAYRLKYPGPHGHTHRVLTPLEFMARLAALLPPPRYPLVRYHGVLAPNAPWRAAIVPVPEHAAPVRCRRACRTGAHAAGSMRASPSLSNDVSRAEVRSELPPAAVARRLPRATTIPGCANPGGTRLDWASLLRRVFDLDVLACPRCPGRLRFIAEVTDRAVIGRVLRHLGEDPEGPPRRAWEPLALDPEADPPWAPELPPPDS